MSKKTIPPAKRARIEKEDNYALTTLLSTDSSLEDEEIAQAHQFEKILQKQFAKWVFKRTVVWDAGTLPNAPASHIMLLNQMRVNAYKAEHHRPKLVQSYETVINTFTKELLKLLNALPTGWPLNQQTTDVADFEAVSNAGFSFSSFYYLATQIGWYNKMVFLPRKIMCEKAASAAHGFEYKKEFFKEKLNRESCIQTALNTIFENIFEEVGEPFCDSTVSIKLPFKYSGRPFKPDIHGGNCVIGEIESIPKNSVDAACISNILLHKDIAKLIMLMRFRQQLVFHKYGSKFATAKEIEDNLLELGFLVKNHVGFICFMTPSVSTAYKQQDGTWSPINRGSKESTFFISEYRWHCCGQKWYDLSSFPSMVEFLGEIFGYLVQQKHWRETLNVLEKKSEVLDVTTSKDDLSVENETHLDSAVSNRTTRLKKTVTFTL